MNFDVFLCYNSKDQPEVQKIAKELENRGIKAWVDKKQLLPGFRWMSIWSDGMDNTRSAAILCGKSEIGVWQGVEIDFFVQKAVEDNFLVIPIILSDAPSHYKLPPLLRQFQLVDFRDRDSVPLERLIQTIEGACPQPPRPPSPRSCWSRFLASFRELVRVLSQKIEHFFLWTYNNTFGRLGLIGLISFILVLILIVISLGSPLCKSVYVTYELVYGSRWSTAKFTSLQDLKVTSNDSTDSQKRMSKVIQEIDKNNETISSGNRVNIAVSVPISRTGSGVDNSTEILRGVALAQNDIISNSNSSIKNVKIFVHIIDEGIFSGKDIARFLVNDTQNNILGVIGHFSSDTLKEASDFYGYKNLAVISPTSTAVRCQMKLWEWANLCWMSDSSVDLNPFVFRTAINDEVAATMLANYAKNAYQNAIILFQPDDSYSRSLRDQFTNKFKDQDHHIIGEYPVSNQELASFDGLSSTKKSTKVKEISKWIEGKVDKTKKTVLLIVPSTKNSERELLLEFASFAQRNGFGLLGGDSMYGKLNDEANKNEANRSANPEWNRMVLAVSWHRKYPASKFQEKDDALFGDGENAVNWRTAMAYEATLAIGKGMEESLTVQCKPKNSCSKNLQEKLSHQDFNLEGSVEPLFNKGDGNVGDSELFGKIGVLVQVKTKDEIDQDEENGKDFDLFKPIPPEQYEPRVSAQ
jgi:ABC-type branched-subunit amino acid transport system substrate-binding protein